MSPDKGGIPTPPLSPPFPQLPSPANKKKRKEKETEKTE